MLIAIDDFLDIQSDIYKKITSEGVWVDGRKFAGFSNNVFNGWMNKDETPSNVFEEVSVKIWEYAKNYTKNYMPAEYDGVEYWFNQLNQGECLPMHKDKDEALHVKTGRIEYPFIGSVYYCHKELPTGGFLEIGRGIRDESHDLERIRPVPNRLVLFNSSNWHSVSEIKRGFRRHFTTNIWIKKPDEDNFKRERY